VIALHRLYDRVLAVFQPLIQIVHQLHVLGEEMNGSKGFSEFRGEVGKYQTGAVPVSCALDLRKAVRCGRIEAIHQAKVEYEKATFRVSHQQGLNVLS
jgi:hypothetical protein